MVGKSPQEEINVFRRIYQRSLPEPYRSAIRKTLKRARIASSAKVGQKKGLPNLQYYLRSRIGGVVRRVEKSRKSIKLKKSIVMANQVSGHDDPLKVVNSILDNPRADKYIVWNALLFLYERRDPAFDFIMENRRRVEDKEISTFLDLRKDLSSPALVDDVKISQYVSFIQGFSKGGGNEAEYRRMLISLIVKALPASKAIEVFGDAGLMKYISIHQVLKILKKASAEGELEAFSYLKSSHENKITRVAAIKVAYWEAALNNDAGLRYLDFQDLFIRLDRSLSKGYSAYLLHLFRKVPEDKALFDATIDDEKLSCIKELFQAAIQEKRGFSFVRLNDGEGYGFSEDGFNEFDIERQERHWWGEVLNTELREEIQKDFVETLAEHDLVGIPSVFRFIDEMAIVRDIGVINNPLIYRLFTASHGYLVNYDGGARLTDGQINLHLFDKSYIEKLSAMADKVCFVSGAGSSSLKSVFSVIDNAEYIEIPTHRLLKNEAFSSGVADKTLPYFYKEVRSKVRSLAKPGVVFFISAGFIGKILSAEASKNGAVALDVGQSLMSIVANDADV